MRTFLYHLWSKFITFIGDIKFFGWKQPFWFVFNASGYKLKGEHYREVIKLIKDGDILLSRSLQYIDTYLIPGYWTHAGLFYGGDKKQVIHAISDGVLVEDIINFMRTDELLILRAPQEHVERALALAKSVVGKEYDFIFDFNNSNRFSCSELIYFCYPKLIKPRKKFGKTIVVADDILYSRNFDIIWDSRFNGGQ